LLEDSQNQRRAQSLQHRGHSDLFEPLIGPPYTDPVTIVHELLHLFGATDKYDPATTQPRYPDGYADPGQSPLYPQQFAEIMGGRIPLSETQSETPRTLDLAIVGDRTAGEIHWGR
jgi:hypothetical protein